MENTSAGREWPMQAGESGRKPNISFRLRMLLPVLLCGAVVVAWNATLASAENWSRFRGSNGTGVSAQKGIPTSWSQGDYAWNVELPGVGHGSPVIWENRLFVTSAVDEGTVRFLFCLNATTGEQLWSRRVGLSRSHKHSKNSWASSTPATDGERVYVAFADEDQLHLAAYDFEGDLVWRRHLGAFQSQHGHGVSPIVFDGMVILPNDQQGPSTVVAVNAETGETVWSVLRSFRRTSYATPMLLELEGQKPQLICLSGATGLTSLDPYTGTQNWISGELPMRTVASPVYVGGLVFALCGGGGSGKLLIGVDPTGSGDVSETNIQFERDRMIPYVPTPIGYEGHLYLWNDNGVVSCINVETGENVWTQRVGGNYSGSPICIDGKLYCMSEEGDLVVLAASPEYKLYGKVSLGDSSHATPAVSNGRLYLRTFRRLMCLEAQP